MESIHELLDQANKELQLSRESLREARGAMRQHVATNDLRRAKLREAKAALVDEEHRISRQRAELDAAHADAKAAYDARVSSLNAAYCVEVAATKGLSAAQIRYANALARFRALRDSVAGADPGITP